MKTKAFHIPADQIDTNLAPGHGSCFATDLITVHGHRVGFMYRENPDDDIDSGWRFFAGTESQDYVDNPENLAIYDVNTIANYDPEIIPLLNAPHRCAFQRDPDSGKFVSTSFPHDPDK